MPKVLITIYTPSIVNEDHFWFTSIPMLSVFPFSDFLKPEKIINLIFIFSLMHFLITSILLLHFGCSGFKDEDKMAPTQPRGIRLKDTELV